MTEDDFGRMATEQIDAFIATAVKERTKRADPHPPEAPKQFDATFNPAWFAFLAGENTVLQIKHLGHGWVSIAFPPRERANLASLFLHHALLAPPKALDVAPNMVPTPTASGGGTVH